MVFHSQRRIPLSKPSRATQQKPEAPFQTQEILNRLVETVERLEAEMRCIRETLDRIQDDFAWSLNNDPTREDTWRPASPPVHISSLPRDPLASDFGERINQVTADELAASREQEVAEDEEKAKPQARSGHLF